MQLLQYLTDPRDAKALRVSDYSSSFAFNVKLSWILCYHTMCTCNINFKRIGLFYDCSKYKSHENVNKWKFGSWSPSNNKDLIPGKCIHVVKTLSDTILLFFWDIAVSHKTSTVVRVKEHGHVLGFLGSCWRCHYFRTLYVLFCYSAIFPVVFGHLFLLTYRKR